VIFSFCVDPEPNLFDRPFEIMNCIEKDSCFSKYTSSIVQRFFEDKAKFINYQSFLTICSSRYSSGICLRCGMTTDELMKKMSPGPINSKVLGSSALGQFALRRSLNVVLGLSLMEVIIYLLS